MAEGKSVGGLYIRLGLSLDELQSGFIAAEKTVQQNIARLNRENNLVRLRAEIDIAGLDAAKDATKILAIQEASLTRQLELQRDKLRLASAAYQEASQNKNINETTTKKLEAAMERERLAVVRLESELKNLSSQKVSIDTARLNDSIAKINAQIRHLKIQAEIDTTRLKDAGSLFEAQKTHIAAVTRELELQKQKYAQLQAQMIDVAKKFGSDSTVTLNIRSNVLQQYQEIQRLETKLKELRSTDVNLKFRTDALKQAEQTISENIARINARIENIRVKADVDVSKISGATAEFDKAKAHVQALNRELELQNQKLAEMKKSLGQSISVNGLNNVKTINLHTEIQRQIQEINQLEAKIKELNNIQPPKSGLLSGYLGIKGDVTAQLNSITTAFSNLRGATSSADSAITSTLGIIDAIPHPVAKAVAAFASLPIVLKGVENSIVDMAKAAASAGDSLYVMSRGWQMSIKDTSKFVSMCKIAGVEVNDMASTIKRVQQTIIRGGEEGKAAKWLKKYGESAFDASGRLKDLNEMSLTLSRGLKKAQAEGNGMAFILATMRNASADTITSLEDLEDNYVKAAKVIGNGLIDPKFAHDVQGEINEMNNQAAKMNATFSAALLPVAHEVVPLLTERMGKITKVIADNKDIIKDFGQTAAEVFKFIEGLAEGTAEVIGTVVKGIHELATAHKKEALEIYLNDESVTTVDELMEKDLIRQGRERELAMVKSNPELYRRTWALYEPILKAIEDERAEIKRQKENLEQEALTLANPNLSEQARRYLEEAESISYHSSHNEYENKLYDLQAWYKKVLQETDATNTERAALDSLYSAKAQQIERDHQEKLEQIRKEATERINQHYQNAADIQFNLTHTAFEKELRDIERWKEAQQEKAQSAEEVASTIAEAAAKEAQAFTNAVDKIKGKVQSLEDKIFAQEHSQYEQDLRRAQQEYYRQYEEFQKMGALDDETKFKLDYWYTNEVNALNRKAGKSREKDDDYLKRPEGTNGQTLDLGLFADEQKIQNQLSQQLSDEGQDLVDKMYSLSGSAQTASEAQDSLAQSAQQASENIQLIEGDKLANDIQNLSTSTQKLTDLQGQLAEATKSGISALQNSEQGTATKSVETPKPATQNHFAEKLRDQAQQLKGNADEATPVKKSVEKTAPITVGKSRDKNSADDDRNIFEKLFSDNRDDTKKNLSPTDAGKSTDIDFSEMLTPLNGIDENVQSIWQKLQGERSDENLDDTSAEISQEAASKFGESLAAPLQKFVQELQAQQTPPTDETPEKISDDQSTLATIAGDVQSIAEKMQATTPESATAPTAEMPEVNFSELLAPLGTISNDVAAIWADMQSRREVSETSTQPDAAAETVDYLTPLTNIRDSVAGMWTKMQAETATPELETQAEVPQENLREIFGQVIANVNSPLSDIVSAIANKQIELPPIELPVETIVQPLDSIGSMVSKIVDLLSNREPPKVEISPSMDIDLGGAYVFDDALKRELVEDITSNIVDKITAAVERATSRVSYG